MKRMLAIWMRLALCASCVALPLAAFAQDTSRANAYTRPHVLRFSTAEDIPTLNPALSTQGAVTVLGRLAMAWLVRYDRSNHPVPELVTVVPTQRNGGIAADGKTIVFHLRHNVRWSDGAPFDADDVVFSIGVINNPANNVPSREGFDLITKVDEPDKFTVRLHLRQPYAAFFPVFFGTAGANPCLLPKHLLGGLRDINQASYNGLPVGIGPFRFKAWRRGDAVELEANPYYWRGRPKLDSVVYKIIPDRNTVLTQLQTGELDLWYLVPGSYYDRIRTEPKLAFIRQPGFILNQMAFNVSRPVMRDPAVRRALELAVDRRLLRDKVSHGLGLLTEAYIPVVYPGAPKLPFVQFDLARANAVLDAAGWKLGPDGVRSKNGMRLAIEFATSSGTPDADLQLEIIREDWQKIGAEMNIKRYQSSLLFATEAEGGIFYSGKFDALFLGRTIGIPHDLHTTFACDSFPPKGENTDRYCNRTLDPLLLAFQRTYGEREQNVLLAKELTIIANDVPAVVTTSREDVFAFNKDLKNFQPNNITWFDDMMNVDI